MLILREEDENPTKLIIHNDINIITFHFDSSVKSILRLFLTIMGVMRLVHNSGELAGSYVMTFGAHRPALSLLRETRWQFLDWRLEPFELFLDLRVLGLKFL